METNLQKKVFSSPRETVSCNLMDRSLMIRFLLLVEHDSDLRNVNNNNQLNTPYYCSLRESPT